MTHRNVNPESLAPAVGFAHATVASPGTTVYLGGQAGLDADGKLVSEDLAEQFDQACANVVEALKAAGAEPEHLVSLQIFMTDVAAYRAELGPVGEAYRRHFGKHFPAMAVLEVTGLFDPGAMVELVGIAVIPS